MCAVENSGKLSDKYVIAKCTSSKIIGIFHFKYLASKQLKGIRIVHACNFCDCSRHVLLRTFVRPSGVIFQQEISIL